MNSLNGQTAEEYLSNPFDACKDCGKPLTLHEFGSCADCLNPSTLFERVKAWAYQDTVSSILHGLHVAFWFWFPHLAGSTLVGIIFGMLAFGFYWQRESVDRFKHPDKGTDTSWDLFVPWIAAIVSIAGVMTHGWR